MTSRAVGTVASLRRTRLFGGAGVATLAFAMVVGFAGPASGHEMSGISADCDAVTVGWSGFPATGVPVHIDANVGSVGTVSKDLTVDDHTAPTKLDISDYARQLSPIERGIIDVEVTWDYGGPQDTHRIFPVLCGGRVTTTTSEGASGALPRPDGNGVNTRAASESSGTNGNSAPASNVEAASETASSTAPTVAANSTTSSTTTSTVAVSAAEATQSGPTASSSDGSLPFTGGPMTPLALIGLSLLAMGAAVAYRTRDRHSPEP